MRRGTVTSAAALALAGSALTAAAAAAGPVRMCDGRATVIAKGTGCAEALWLADHARAGERITGWRVWGNSAGVVRLRHGRSWVKVRRVPRKSVAALLTAGLRIDHVHGPAADGSSGDATLAFCSSGRIQARSHLETGMVGTPPGPVISGMTAQGTTGSWTPLFVGEWRGGRTLELHTSMSGPFDSEGIALARSQRIRLELRDDRSGTLTAAAGPRPVRWSRIGNSCPAAYRL